MRDIMYWVACIFPALNILKGSLNPHTPCYVVLDLGVIGVQHVPRKCRRCQQCPSCVISEDGRSIQEQQELDFMRQSLRYDPEKKQVTISYPVKGDPKKFKD